MYNVIIVLDEKRNKKYYHSYVAQNGNIECEDLPPYQDIDMARAHFWDADVSAWIFDADKHAEITAERAAAEAAADQAQREADAVPSNADLTMALMEIADDVSTIMDALTEIADKVAYERGGE